MGSVGSRSGVSSGAVSVNDFVREVARQGLDIQDVKNDLEDYMTSSYGGLSLGDRLSDFIEKAPRSMMYNDGTLYRGLWFETQSELDNFLRQHQVGSTLKTRRDGLSWSADESVAQEFSTEVSEHAVILVNNDTNRIAMGIGKIADIPVALDEVLYSNKVDFTVTKVENRGDIHYIYVKQKRSKGN